MCLLYIYSVRYVLCVYCIFTQSGMFCVFIVYLLSSYPKADCYHFKARYVGNKQSDIMQKSHCYAPLFPAPSLFPWSSSLETQEKIHTDRNKIKSYMLVKISSGTLADLLVLDCLIGLVVKASASRAEDPGFESRLHQGFYGVESYQ